MNKMKKATAKMNNLDTTPRLVDQFNKNASEVIRTQFITYNNRQLLDIRTWVLKNGKDFVPTRKGICLRVDQVDSLKQAIEKAAEEIEKA